MSWEKALEYARERATATNRRWYVSGYRRTLDRGWRYGAYRERPQWEPGRR